MRRHCRNWRRANEIETYKKKHWNENKWSTHSKQHQLSTCNIIIHVTLNNNTIFFCLLYKITRLYFLFRCHRWCSSVCWSTCPFINLSCNFENWKFIKLFAYHRRDVYVSVCVYVSAINYHYKLLLSPKKKTSFSFIKSKIMVFMLVVVCRVLMWCEWDALRVTCITNCTQRPTVFAVSEKKKKKKKNEKWIDIRISADLKSHIKWMNMNTQRTRPHELQNVYRFLFLLINCFFFFFYLLSSDATHKWLTLHTAVVDVDLIVLILFYFCLPLRLHIWSI